MNNIPLPVNQKIMEEKILVQAKCNCGNEILEVEYWADEGVFCFAQYKYMPIKYGVRRRLKFLFTGKIDYNEIILDSENVKYIADYINNNINKNDKKENQETVG
jgi:hypothetical protein